MNSKRISRRLAAAVLLTGVLGVPDVLAAVHGPVSYGQGASQDTADRLKALSLSQLGQVKVVTENKEPTEIWNTPAAVYVLTAEEIRRSGVTNIPDALRLVPGVDVARVSGDRNWAVGIRGLADQFSKYVLVLIDGRSIYTPLFGGTFYTINNVMLEDIDRIEVIRGPGGTIWGTDAVNGIINIITKSAKDTQGELASAGGGNVDQDTEDLRYGGHSHQWDFRTDAFGFVRGPEHHQDGQKNYDWSRLGQVGFRTDWQQGRDSIVLEGNAYLSRLGDAQPLSTYNPPTTFISYHPTDALGGNLLGRWRRDLPSEGGLYLQAYWAYDNRIGPNFGETRNTIDVDFLHRTGATARQQFTYGFGARVSPSSTTQTAQTYSFVPADMTEYVYSAFVQESVKLVPNRLALETGLKLEWNNYTHFEEEPNVRLLWTPTRQQTVWAALSRAVRIPDRVDENIHDDIFAVEPPPIFGEITGNPRIHSERLTAFEGGYRTLVTPKLYISLAGFHNVYDDLIAQSAASLSNPGAPFPPGTLLVKFTYQNGIEGDTDGYELGPEWDPLPWLRFKAAYSYLHIDLRDKAGFTNSSTLITLHGSSPNQQVVGRALIDLPRKLEFDPAIRYVSALPGQGVDAYETADLHLGWHPSRNWDLSVTGENLLQPYHAEFGITPEPNVGIKRSVYAKLTWYSR